MSSSLDFEPPLDIDFSELFELPEIDMNFPELDFELPEVDMNFPELDFELPEVDKKYFLQEIQNDNF